MTHKIKVLLLAIMSIFLTCNIASAETIAIVSDTAYAPFEFKDSDQIYKGIDVDIINEVAKRQSWDFSMSFPGFDAAVNAVQSGQASALMAGTTITNARKKVFHFSEPYYDTKIVIATRKANAIKKYSDLKGKTVGVKNGTAAQAFLNNYKKKYDYTVKTFDTGDLMYNSLSAGSIAAVMDDEAVIQYAISQNQDIAINMKGEPIGSFGFAVKKGSGYNYLVNDFNTALKAMKADGTYQAIMTKWLGTDDKATTSQATGNPSAKATPIKDSYKIVSDSSFAPFEFQNGKGKYVGIDIELIKAIAKQQGFKIEIANPGFDAALNAVQSSQADGVIAGATITDARKAIFDFSDPYYTSNIILAVKAGKNIKNYEDLDRKTVGAKNGTSSYSWLKENAPKYGYNVKAFDDGSSMYDSLNSGSVDAIMDDEAVLKYAISQGRRFETPLEGISTGEVGFAVKKGTNPELIEMFNNGLAALKKSGQYDDIIDKYLDSKKAATPSEKGADESTISGLLSNNYKQLLAGLGTTLSLTLISFAIAIIIGIIFGMMAVSPTKSLRLISTAFVDVVRGIPLMIVAAFIFWGVPNLIESMTGHQSPINDFLAATIALSLNGGAYI
ncbi:TPA: ABC transporter permease subunit, partial [Streptococcus pyogenes MGAS3370]|nr:ABC transporter permease subunit [Streptococcus pyogenes MGAS3370]HER5238764.1 ABC transporter permease subunit [Streptococcus pyogenes MGAS3393]HER5240603.1 ABC transporter permease subunit [Streptococcus pyogenes MGAS10002]HER5247875.1 ABC transporter permease subunit [Streptococcus pyogenes MGAS9908]HER5253235.1 ABC transporter permease subunit [Streptococcus pyogenes MGAS9893]HER5258417.1 ABC transporter permease subunit [Streptococcus pyogenes MGAS10041]HER5260616.1 ABC transporter pe